MESREPDRLCVFDIQRMSLHDGPGIRTNIFLKGCNLRCFWCHNPESWNVHPDIQYFEAKCIGCGGCVSVCPLSLHGIGENGVHVYKRDGCTVCGKCAEVCPSESLVLTGRMMTLDEIVKAAKRDMPFYEKSNGGVTVSGGEPLLQYAAAAKLLERLKDNGVHTALESALCVPEDHLDAVIPYTDLFLVDMKVADAEQHKKFTGASNLLIKKNFHHLDDLRCDYCMRIPLVPGVNDNEEAISQIAEFASELSRLSYAEFLPYHSLGEGKFKSLGLEFRKDLQPPSKEKMAVLAGIFPETVEVRY
ncbi:MAG: glycyl-radical enzyme activating protein [Treponema sp.]|nr:glycyl-radical enzyme activating protein [Treponema sp.]